MILEQVITSDRRVPLLVIKLEVCDQSHAAEQVLQSLDIDILCEWISTTIFSLLLDDSQYARRNQLQNTQVSSLYVLSLLPRTMPRSDRFCS